MTRRWATWLEQAANRRNTPHLSEAQLRALDLVADMSAAGARARRVDIAVALGVDDAVLTRCLNGLVGRRLIAVTPEGMVALGGLRVGKGVD